MIDVRKVRWLRQRDAYSCVPVALMNIAKAFGEGVTYQDLPKYKKLCHTNSEGSDVYTSRKLLFRDFHVKKQILHPTMSQLRKYLAENYMILLRSCTLYSAHLFILAAATESSFYCVNIYRGHGWVPNQNFKDWYLKKTTSKLKSLCTPYAYVIDTFKGKKTLIKK